jgi:ferredoxin/flavodoxin---NADP+ reductase
VPDHVTFGDWQAIDAHEQERGTPHGRPRVKLVDTAEMVEVSRRARSAPTGG